MFRVMLVEDDDQIATIIAAELERYGYEVLRVDDFANISWILFAGSPI